MKIIKTVAPYFLIFCLIYLGPVQVGPTTFSQFWKIPLFGFLIWQVLIIRNRRKPAFIKWSYARAAKNLVTSGFSVSYFVGIIDFLRYMMFPLMFEYASVLFKNTKQLDKVLLGFAQFIIISGIPFVLGVLESKVEEIVDVNIAEGFSGMFQNTHGASITTTTAVLIVLAYLRFKSGLIKYTKLNYALLFFGVYLIYLTYIRTGYAMFFIGLIILFVPKKFSVKQIVTAGSAIAVLLFGFFYLLETNQDFYNRIFDIRNGQQSAAGSGRLLFWKASVDLWYNGDFFEMLFGFGFDGLVDAIYKAVGLRVYAHNEFFTQLGQNGLLGIIFFLGYLISLFKFIWERRKRPSYRLSMAIFFLYVSLMMTQGGMWFELDVFMVLVFVKLEFEDRIYKKQLRIHQESRASFEKIHSTS